MTQKKIKTEDIFSITTAKEFRRKALEVFQYQYCNNPVYGQFCDLLNRTPDQVRELEHIPFLPIEFFKTHSITTRAREPEVIFTSSGTTGSTPSRHLVYDVEIYEKSFQKGFQIFYGDIQNYAVLALLPSYLEREGSSLIYMVNDLIRSSGNPHSGFYLHNYEEFSQKLEELDAARQPTLVIGVSYALLDVAHYYPLKLDHAIIMETGGMKGRRKEIIRQELHEHLKKGFGTSAIHSEYGMTELLSQAYSERDGHFRCPPWMNIMIRDPEEPTNFLKEGKTGGINVIDLANVYSCSFLATQDLGKQLGKGLFEILGRFDHADIRGCNLMVL